MSGFKLWPFYEEFYTSNASGFDSLKLKMSSYVLNLNKSVEPHNFHGGGMMEIGFAQS